MAAGVIRIALADDQALVRSGLRALLEGIGGIEVALEAGDGGELLQRLNRERVDVIVADIRMPQHSGIEVVRALRARGDYTPALLLTTFDEPGLLPAATRAGAQGFLLKDAAPEELAEAIRALAAGESRLVPISLGTVPPPPAGATAPRLTAREIDVLRLVAGGYSNKEIGRMLNISDGTVKNHLTEILAKLEARDRTHAVLKAIATRQL